MFVTVACYPHLSLIYELCSCEIDNLAMHSALQSFVSWADHDYTGCCGTSGTGVRRSPLHREAFRNRGAFKRLIRRPARRTVKRRELWVPSIAKIVESFLFYSSDSRSDVTSFQFPAVAGIMRMSIREPVRCDVPPA